VMEAILTSGEKKSVVVIQNKTERPALLSEDAALGFLRQSADTT